MACITICDRFWADERLDLLASKLGETRDFAVGFVLRFWRLSQKHWAKNKSHVPKSEYDILDPQGALVAAQFAQITDQGIYCKGAETRFGKILANQSNGQKGGRPKAKKTHDKPTGNPQQTHDKPTGLLIPSIEGRKQEVPDLNRRIWASYVMAYQNRWGREPVRNATVNGQVAQLGKRLGEEAIEVVKFYVEHNDSFYVKNCHPIGLCLKQAEGLRTQWANGRPITGGAIKIFEQSQKSSEFRDMIERGEI